MLNKARAKMLVKLLLPVSALLIVAISVLVGLSLAQANHPRVARVIIDPPATTQTSPKIMTLGGTADFTVRVLPGGALVNSVTISMRFNPTFLEVVDQNPLTPAVEIRPHPANPLNFGVTENIADNINGTILFTAGHPSGASVDFNFAVVTFQAKNTETVVNIPTEVEFLVDDGNDTAVAAGAGHSVLENTEDFTGAWVEVSDRRAELVIDNPDSSPLDPVIMQFGGTRQFTVRVLPNGQNMNSAGLSMTFDPTFLEVVDADLGQPDIQIQPHPDSPLTSFTLENLADNVAGTIRYAAGVDFEFSDPFNMAIVTFRAKDVATGPASTTEALANNQGPPTEIRFLVDDGRESYVTNTTERQLLKNLEDFTEAWIEVVEPQFTKASFTATPDPADEASPVTFDATGSTSASGDLTYDWTFGDGGTGDQPIEIYTYYDDDDDDTYTIVYGVTLTVTDDDGTGDSTSDDITVNNVPPTINNITATLPDIDEGQSSNISVDASDVAGVNDPLSYSFDCNNDNNFEVGPQPGSSTDCAFPDGSVHTVNVKVEDDDQGVSTDSVDVTVNNVDPTLTISGDPSVNEGESYTLNLESDDPGDDTIQQWTIFWDDPLDPVAEVVLGDPASVDHTYADGPANPTITASAEDEDGGPYNANALPITVNNLPPNITNVVAVLDTLPVTGGDSTITVTATDPAGVNDPLLYSFDCDNDSVFEVGPQLGISTICSFDQNDTGNNTVNVKVDDQDGGIAEGSVNVNVKSDVDVNDWTGNLSFSGTVESGPLVPSPPLTLGIRPGCTDFFEFDTGSPDFDECDDPISKAVPATNLSAFFDYPKYPPEDANFIYQRLLKTRIAPPLPERRTLMFPVRVEINSPGHSSADVTVEWEMDSIPDEFITVLLIDHDTLPAFNIINMGSNTMGTYSIPGGVPLDANGQGSRDITVVITRAHVQALRLVEGTQIISLTVKPIFGSKVADIFKFRDPDRFSLREDRRLRVFGVTMWFTDPATPLPISGRGIAPVFVGDPRHPEMVPSFGYIVNLGPPISPTDVMLIIPGEPIVEHTRSSP